MKDKQEEIIESQICPLCAGRQVISFGNRTKSCPQCEGKGSLEVGIYRIKDYPFKAINKFLQRDT